MGWREVCGPITEQSLRQHYWSLRSLSRLGTHASPSTNQILGSKEINHDLIVCAFLLSRPLACFTLSINRSLVMLPCSD